MRGTENLFGRFLSIFGGKVLTTVVAVVSTPVVVRLLGAGGYGDYAVLLSVFSLYMIPISAGITEGVQKFVAEDRDLPNWSENVIRFYLLLAVVVVLVGATVLLAFTEMGFAATLFDESFTRYFYLLVGFVLAAQFRAVAYHTVLGFGLEHISESLVVVKKLVTVLLGIALVLTGLDVVGMLVGHIVASLVVALVAGAVITRRVSVRALFGGFPDAFPFRELLSFNALNIGLVMLVLSLSHVDVIMLRSLASGETTGYYKAALALAEYLWFVPIALQMLLLHSTSALWSDGQTDRITALAARITRYTVLLVVLMAIGMATLADRFVPLYYGESFAVATTPFLLLLPGAVGYAAARPMQAIGQGSGRIRTLLVATAGPALLNVVLNAALIPRFGMYGAAAATSVGYGSMFVFLVWASRQIGYRPLADIRSARIAATALLSAPIIVLFEAAITSELLALAVVPPVGCAIFTASALLTGALDRTELVDIGERLPAPLGAVVKSSTAWAED